jgi:hypothetical protein
LHVAQCNPKEKKHVKVVGRSASILKRQHRVLHLNEKIKGQIVYR